MAPKPRRKRSNQMKFDTKQMAEELQPFAKLRPEELKFKFDGSHYAKPTRSLGPDLQGMEDGSDVLHILARYARNGYPAVSDMIEVWNDLDRKYKFIPPKDGTAHEDRLYKVVDLWRVQLRHAVEI